MNLQQLKYIIEIADCRSITKASKKLFVSQPYLSKVVSDFEAKIGRQIFIRHNNGLELTACGHKAYLLAQSIISQMKHLDNLGREEAETADRVKLAFSVGNLILKDSLLLKFFSTTHASVKDVDFYETTIEECIKNVEENISEFAIVVLDDFQKKLFTGISARKDLTWMELDEGSPYCHFHQNHPLSGQDEIHIDSLMQYPFVRLKTDQYARFSNEKWKKEYPDLCVHRCIVVNHYHSYLNIIKHNHSTFAIGNKWQISELAKKGVQSIRFASSNHKVHLMIIKKEFIPLSPEAKKFIHLFKDSYGLNGT